MFLGWKSAQVEDSQADEIFGQKISGIYPSTEMPLVPTSLAFASHND